MNKKIQFLILLYLYNIIYCQNVNREESSQEELTTCEKEPYATENTFILKTNLSENEIEKLLSQDFSSLSNDKRRRQNKNRKNEIDVKQFKSKDNLNKTILLMEINNVSEFSYNKNEKEANDTEKTVPYELIDVKENDETKIFLSFDKFFRSQYKEMFDYSYTIIIAFFVFIGMFVYYALLLPNEAHEISRSMGSRPINMMQGNINNENGNDNNYILKE